MELKIRFICRCGERLTVSKGYSTDGTITFTIEPCLKCKEQKTVEVIHEEVRFESTVYE